MSRSRSRSSSAGSSTAPAVFGVIGETVTFNASATVKVPHVAGAELKFTRDENGVLHAVADVPVELPQMTGAMHFEYLGGTVIADGEASYESEKFSGKIHLMLTDPDTARNIARQHLPAEAFRKPVTPASDGGAPADGAPALKPGPRALAGAGEINVKITDWLTGKAGVVIDNEGNLTVSSEIIPPAEVELFPQKDYIKPLAKLEARALYGLPVVGNVFVFANVGLEAVAKLGPGKLYGITIAGRYSTDPGIRNTMTITGTLNVSAFAGVRLRAEGGAGVQLLGHDIKAGVGVSGLAGVNGYVEATPTLGYRETAETAKGEFFLHGHMELAAQPFLQLSGDLFVEVDAPFWSPLDDEKWTWPLGQLEYPLPGAFGIGADVDYVIGSKELPEVKFGEVTFDGQKFMDRPDERPRSSEGRRTAGAEGELERGRGRRQGCQRQRAGRRRRQGRPEAREERRQGSKSEADQRQEGQGQEGRQREQGQEEGREEGGELGQRPQGRGAAGPTFPQEPAHTRLAGKKSQQHSPEARFQRTAGRLRG